MGSVLRPSPRVQGWSHLDSVSTLAVTRIVGPSLSKPAQPPAQPQTLSSTSPALQYQSQNAKFAVSVRTLPTHSPQTSTKHHIRPPTKIPSHPSTHHNNNQQQPPSRTTWIYHPSLIINNTHSQRPWWYSLPCLSVGRLYPHGPLGSCRQQKSPKNSSARTATVDKHDVVASIVKIASRKWPFLLSPKKRLCKVRNCRQARCGCVHREDSQSQMAILSCRQKTALQGPQLSTSTMWLRPS